MAIEDDMLQAEPGHAPVALVPHDGRAGHLRQAAALARALGMHAAVLPTPLRMPWRGLAPRNAPLGWALHRREWSPLPERPPRVIIGCGRRSALAGLWLREHWGGTPALVQILDCGLPPGRFDAVIVPRHDRLRGERVITMTGSLNPVDEAWLAAGAGAWRELAELPVPRVTVLLGGPARGTDFRRAASPAVLARWGDDIAARNGSLVLVASPRTPPGWLDAVADGWAGIPAARLDWPASEPRYASALAHATHLLVTADSTNLLSEACATGRPVAVLGGETARGRRAGLLESLREAGPLVDVDEWLDHGPVEPLREAPRVAESLRGLLGAR
ncbi:MAG: ELM1/GtrOC1 family putative glycosyltransferase [Xanthomonadales bacterium]|nr:ELM1/GtrOC1 family putative glycosyltransferase [Xanthomonadales bacterium]